MPMFQYKAKRYDGKKISGVIELDDEAILIDRLHRKRAVLLSVKRLEADQANSIKRGLIEELQGKLKSLANTVSHADILLFSHQLAAMFGAGVPLSRCLESLSRDLQNKKLREIMSDIYRDIESGDDFSEALAKHPQVFNKLYSNMVRAGESSGTLAIILNQLASYLENSQNVRGKIKAALTYPIVLMGFGFLITIGLLLFIIPQFSQMYQRFNAPLPLPTRIMLGISQSLRQGFLFYILGLFGFWLLFWLILQTPQGKYNWDRMKLKIPVIGPLLLKGVFAQFSRTLSILSKSGLPIIQSIKIVSDSISNTFIEKKMEECSLKIQKGATISEAFAESKVFPELMLQMISSGEESGTLVTMLAKIGDFYQQQIDATVSSLTSLIEPFLIILVGLMVGSIAISVFLPIFKMGGVIR